MDINKATKHSIVLYPNPVENELHLINTNNLNITKMTIADVSGKVIYNQSYSSNVINVSNLQSGIYLVQIETDTEIIIEKFIKN